MASARGVVASGAAVLAVLAVLAALAAVEGEDGAALSPREEAAGGGALDVLLHSPLEDLLRVASLACDALPLEEMFREVRVPQLQVVEVSARGRRVLPVSRAAPQPLGTVTVYVPGWWNTPEDAAARALVAALLRHERTVLVVDTRPAFCRPYLAAAARVPAVARQVARLVRGLPPASLHLVGFSLGAHAAGRAGRLVRARRGGAGVGRITALDPARPCFGAARAARGVGREDAAFVQVVHSSAGALGVARAAGHADVYVGRRAACRARRVPLECDHNEAWRVFARSARVPTRGRACRDWSELAAGACSGKPTLLGYSCSNQSRGIYLYNSPEIS